VNRACCTILVAVFVVFSTLLFVGPTASAGYVAEDIGCEGYRSTYATGINDLDQIVGYRYDEVYTYREAVVYDSGSGDWTVLPDYGTDPGLWGVATAINEDGAIVGYCNPSTSLSLIRGAYWPANGGDMVVLEALSSGSNSAAYGMNDVGEAVGYSTGSAVMWNLDPLATSIMPVALGTLPGMSGNYATDINNNHAVVGYSQISLPSHVQAFYCASPGSPLTALPPLSEGVEDPDSVAHAISDSGLIVGYCRDSAGMMHAVAWQSPYDTPPIDLGMDVGVQSIAFDVSTDQKIVGLTFSTEGDRGFVYDFPETTFEYLPPPPGGYSSRGIGINEFGHVVGWGVMEGTNEIHTILWTPDAPPVAAFTAIISGFDVTVNASASYDAEGEIADYSWDFGDGTYDFGMVVTHTYTDVGPYTIILRVNDSIGQGDIISQVVGFDKTPESEIAELIMLIEETSFEQDIKDRLTRKALKALDLIEIRKKGSDDGPANILLSLDNLVSNYVLAGDIADEYEAWDVIAKTNFVISLLTENHMIASVPTYTWHHGCGPTAAGMLLGYWDATGFGELVKGPQGNEMYQSDEVNTMIASQSHIDDYAWPYDGWVEINGEMVWVPLTADRSENGTATDDDCIADFMHTSRSAEGLVWGQSYANMADDALVEYTTWASGGDYVANVESLQMGSLTWEILQSEVNAAHPMVFVIDWNGDAVTDHLITVFGYCEVGNAQLYAFYSTWDNYVYWALFDLMHEGNFYGVSSGITFSISLAS
jgi:uncharacterized membrane protein